MGILIHKGGSDNKTRGYIRSSDSVTSASMIVLDNSHLVDLMVLNDQNEQVLAHNAIQEDVAISAELRLTIKTDHGIEALTVTTDHSKPAKKDKDGNPIGLSDAVKKCSERCRQVAELMQGKLDVLDLSDGELSYMYKAPKNPAGRPKKQAEKAPETNE